MPPISGQSILVIGGSSGIGFGVAKLALAENVRVAIASSNETRVKDAVERLKKISPSGDITGFVADLNLPDPEPVLEKLLKEATAKGPLDHIISTAVRVELRPFPEVDASYILRSSQLLQVVPILIAKLGPKYLKPAYTSSITYSTGQVVEKPVAGFAIYAGFGGATHALARSFALDLKPLRFNVVAPGSTDTELWGEAADMIRKNVTEKALLGKPASPEEVAEAYIYLMKNTNATGSIVSSSGGGVLQ